MLTMNSLQRIHFLPRHLAEGITPAANCGVISIKTPSDEDATLHRDWAAVLRLAFFDSDGPLAGQGGRTPPLDGAEFDAAMAEQVVSFLQANSGLVELVVHCDLGISRSAGVALCLGEVLSTPVYRRGAPVDPRYSQYNRLVYRQLMNAVFSDQLSVFTR